MPQLTEPNRAKLDDIVRRMADAGEPDDAISFVVSDFKSKYALPDKPVSAEDFTGTEKSGAAKAWDYARGLGRATVGGAIEAAKAASDLYGGTLGGDLAAHQRTGERIKGAIGAQVGEFSKARERFQQGRGSEGVGHTLAGLVPLIGPAVASAAERMETDPYAAAGELTGLLGTLGLPKVAPRVPAAAGAVGRGAQAVGRAASGAARKAGPAALEIAKTGALEGAAHAVGLPPLVASGARLLLENALKSAKASKAEAAATEAARAARMQELAGGRLVKAKAPTAEAAIADALQETQAVDLPQSVELPPAPELPPGYEPRTTAPAPVPSPNVGGRLVREKSPAPFTAELEAAIADIRAAEPPVAGTLPPQPELPAGYTPRTMAPKPKPAEAAPKPRAERPEATKRPEQRKSKPSATIGQKNYFLRKDAPAVERAEPRAVTVEDLPASWKVHTGQTLTKPGRVTKIDVNEVRSYLDESGLTAEEAIDALSRDRSLKTPDRIRLVEAINKTRFRRAQ